MRLDSTLLLASGATVSARTITLPLRSLSAEQDGHSRRGVTRYRQTASTSNGVNVPITDWFNRTDNQWYTTFSVGTPPQNFTALLDTGSADFLIGMKQCTSCGTKNLYDADASSTYLAEPGTEANNMFSTGPDSLPFSEPEGATGFHVTDTLALGDLKMEKQTFVISSTMTEAMNRMPIDGIMGLSLPRDKTSWYWRLVESGALESPLYSFYLSTGGSESGQVTLGGIDDTKHVGDIKYTKLDADGTADSSAYTLAQTALYAGGKLLANGTAADAGAFANGWAILDTGTAFMQTPDFQTAANIYAQISDKIKQIDPAGAWGAPCDELDAVAPDLTFTLGGLNVTVPKKAFNLGEYPGQAGTCQALFNNPSDGIGNSWFSGSNALWLIGSPLLKQYYTVWDGVGEQIGWGQLDGGVGF